MGLDNGIKVNRNGKCEEVCYWRKCNELRANIFDIISKYYEYDTELDWIYTLTTPMLEDICELLKSYRDKMATNMFDPLTRIKESLEEDIENIESLIQLSKEDPDALIYFYDSM